MFKLWWIKLSAALVCGGAVLSIGSPDVGVQTFCIALGGASGTLAVFLPWKFSLSKRS